MAFKISDIWPFRLFKTSLSNPSASLLSALTGPGSQSGAEVTAESVISITSMWRAIDLLGGTTGSLPFEVIEQSPDGNITIAKTHPLYRVINLDPNPLYTSFTYRHTSMVHACLFGNWISRIVYDSKRNVKNLIIVDPREVEQSINKDSGDLFYEIGGKKYPSHEIIHIPNLSFSGLTGFSILDIHKNNFGLGLSNREYMNTYYKNGTMISGVLEHPENLTDEQYKRLKQSFQIEYGGSENRGKTPILEGGTKFKQTNASMGDSQSISTQKLSLSDVARITGVPPHMLASMDAATFNNIESLSLEFAMYTIRPWVKRIEQEFNRKIFKTTDQGKYKVRLNMDAIMRGNTEARAEFYRVLWGMGAINRDEIRAREKLNKIPGGDVYYVPMNMSPVGEDGQPVFTPKNSQEKTDSDD